MSARFRDIARAAARFEIKVVPGGKHNRKLVRQGYRSYTIPAHNGDKSEVTDPYISGLCRNFQIDEPTFRKLL
jgi:hypothetical protein